MIVISLISSYFFLTIIQLTRSDVHVYNNLNELIRSFDDQTADFGPSFPEKGLKGYLTTTDPVDGCKNVSPPPNIATLEYHWIALIPRTKDKPCEFSRKVKNAQYANFSAVIIYNYEDKIIKMGGTGKNVRIPSTFITCNDGLSLLSSYLYNKTLVNLTSIYHIKIMPDKSIKPTVFFVPVIVVVVFSFLSVIGFILIKVYLRRRRTRHHRLPRSALKQLKTKKFTKGDPWEVCAICLDEYEEGTKLRILPCDHAYHMKCIDPWLLNNRRQCPVCKRYVLPDPENSDEEDNNDHQSTTTFTEQTPLMHSNDNNSLTEISEIQQQPERRLHNPTARHARNVSFASTESSNSAGDLSSSSRLPSTNHATAIRSTSDRSSSSVRGYGSMNDPITTPRVANFFVGSIGGTTDNTNVSARSIVEDVSDIEVINDDGSDRRIHFITFPSVDNLAYVNDDGSTANTHHSYT